MIVKIEILANEEMKTYIIPTKINYNQNLLNEMNEIGIVDIIEDEKEKNIVVDMVKNDCPNPNYYKKCIK